MRLRLATMMVLLAFASRTYGRPSDPDPSADVVPDTTVPPTLDQSVQANFNSRYMSTSTALPISIFRKSPISSDAYVSSFKSLSDVSSEILSKRRSRRSSPTFRGLPVTVGPHILEELTAGSQSSGRSLDSGPILPMSRSYDDSKDLPASMRTRNYVRITPQKLRPGYNVIRNKNFTNSKHRVPNLTDDLKNWPNEAIQNVQDFFNYDKYVSSIEEEYKTKPPKHKSPGTNEPIRWTKVPVVSLDEVKSDVKIVKPANQLIVTSTSNNKTKAGGVTSQVAQSTVVHIVNPGFKEPNVTSTATKLKSPVKNTSRPPQNVHIMFMVDDKDAGTLTHQVEDLPPLAITGTDKDCPTVVINSITQINNTIESKEGCNDLNIVINSHLLQNTKKVKPDQPKPNIQLGTTQVLKAPPGPPYIGNHQSTVNYGAVKDPAIITAESSDGVQSTLELIQNTHINLLSSPQVEESVPEEAVAALEGEADYDDEEVEEGLAAAPEGVQTNDAGGSINLPSLPAANLPSQVSNLASNAASGGSGGSGSADTAIAPVEEEEDDDDGVFGLGYTAAGLLDSMASVYSQFSELNPINYGIFGMAVAPFVAFAAGVVGVATFLFPWAFPGSIDVSRSLRGDATPNVYHTDDGTDTIKKIVKRSTFELSEWKYRRRKKRVDR